MSEKSKKQKKYRKVVEWRNIREDNLPFPFELIITWGAMIFFTLTFPIWYIYLSRNVYWEEIK